MEAPPFGGVNGVGNDLRNFRDDPKILSHLPE
jgi:hypothetical protein